jgi:hypothetical protein
VPVSDKVGALPTAPQAGSFRCLLTINSPNHQLQSRGKPPLKPKTTRKKSCGSCRPKWPCNWSAFHCQLRELHGSAVLRRGPLALAAPTVCAIAARTTTWHVVHTVQRGAVTEFCNEGAERVATRGLVATSLHVIMHLGVLSLNAWHLILPVLGCWLEAHVDCVWRPADHEYSIGQIDMTPFI